MVIIIIIILQVKISCVDDIYYLILIYIIYVYIRYYIHVYKILTKKI